MPNTHHGRLVEKTLHCVKETKARLIESEPQVPSIARRRELAQQARVTCQEKFGPIR